MDLDTYYPIEPDEYYSSGYYNGLEEWSITLIFLISILGFLSLCIVIAVLIMWFKPQLFRQNLYNEPIPKMADCSCLNVCLPCNSWSCREGLNGCCPRMNLASFNCFKTFCTRSGTEKINLVCCVV